MEHEFSEQGHFFYSASLFWRFRPILYEVAVVLQNVLLQQTATAANCFLLYLEYGRRLKDKNSWIMLCKKAPLFAWSIYGNGEKVTIRFAVVILSMPKHSCNAGRKFWLRRVMSMSPECSANFFRFKNVAFRRILVDNSQKSLQIRTGFQTVTTILAVIC